MRVLVTRPQPGASKTARRLSAMGHEPVVMPLASAVALSVPDGSRLSACVAVAATSAQALHLADRGLLEVLRDKPLFAVGAATAEAARSSGFLHVEAGGSDAADLAGVIARRVPHGADIAYLCGRVRTDALETALSANGMRCHLVEVYDVRPREPTETELTHLGEGGAIGAVLLYSRDSAARFAGFRARPDVAAMFGRAVFLCLSPQVVSGLGEHGGNEVLAAPIPTEDALLALLEHGAGTDIS